MVKPSTLSNVEELKGICLSSIEWLEVLNRRFYRRNRIHSPRCVRAFFILLKTKGYKVKKTIQNHKTYWVIE